MKLTFFISALVAGATAFPAFPIVNLIEARAASVPVPVKEACNIGYCMMNGGTTGGAAGSQTTVTSLNELITAAGAKGPAIIIVDGALTGSKVVNVASDKSIIGATGSSLTGIGLRIKDVSNVIVRNIKISKVPASVGDAIGIQASSNVWIDHCDLSSDLDHGKDFYDGLCDITHASDYITVSNTYFHDHFKASLVGHSDSNSAEDSKHLIVTFAYNHWSNVNSRGPSFRFGTGHIFNSLMENMDSGINTRMGAEVLVESCVFSGVGRAIESTNSGHATLKDVDLGGGTNTASSGSLSTVPYKYNLLGAASLKLTVTNKVGQTLTV